MYLYQGFGLLIKSEIFLPELAVTDVYQPADLCIRYGPTPVELLDDGAVHRPYSSTSPDGYLLKIPGIANYYVPDGSLVIVEAIEGVEEQSIRLFLLGSVMAAVVHFRDMLPFHASGIYHQNGVVLFSGKSGAGKSTIVTALEQRGYRIFCDDICVMQPSATGYINAFPSYPMVKMWENSYRLTGIELAEDAWQIRPQMPKYGRFFHDNFEMKSLPVLQVFILETQNQVEDVTTTEIKFVEAFKIVREHTFRQQQVNEMKKRQLLFYATSQLASSAKVVKLSRPGGANSLERVIEQIEKSLNS